jgi:hypothetical protein
MRDYFVEYGRKEPTGRYHTINAYAQGDPELTVWDHVNKDPKKKEAMMTAMMAMAKRMPMAGSYDYSWVLDKAKETPERVLIVDVGGGRGHALEAIAEVTPGLPLERCVVGDLEAVANEAKSAATGDLAKAQFLAIDFHAAPPVTGMFSPLTPSSHNTIGHQIKDQRRRESQGGGARHTCGVEKTPCMCHHKLTAFPCRRVHILYSPMPARLRRRRVRRDSGAPASRHGRGQPGAHRGAGADEPAGGVCRSQRRVHDDAGRQGEDARGVPADCRAGRARGCTCP